MTFHEAYKIVEEIRLEKIENVVESKLQLFLPTDKNKWQLSLSGYALPTLRKEYMFEFHYDIKPSKCTERMLEDYSKMLVLAVREELKK